MHAPRRSGHTGCLDNIHENGDGKGMDMHRDKHSGFTIVLVFEVLIEGFMQLYPTSASCVLAVDFEQCT